MEWSYAYMKKYTYNQIKSIINYLRLLCRSRRRRY